jgi:hypothetical protein
MADPSAGERWPGLLALGYPKEPRPLPAGVAEMLGQSRLPGDYAIISQFNRAKGVEVLTDAAAGVWAVGVGCTDDGAPAVAYFADPGKRETALSRVGQKVTIAGKEFRVVVIELKRQLRLDQGDISKPPYTGARSGCFVSTSPDGLFIDGWGQRQWSGGTLGGVFHSAAGHSIRGLTNAHVALDAGIEDLLANLPNSLRDLLASPKGKLIYAWDNGDNPNGDYQFSWSIGEPYVLFEVDTDTSILTPIPFIPGLSPAVAMLMPVFIYTDIAAGDIRPQAVPGHAGPPAAPPPRRSIRGGHLGASKIPLPGKRTYKIGSATGTVWGSVLAMEVITVWPLPPVIPLLPPQILIFNLDVYTMREEPGDSGSIAVLEDGHHPASLCGLWAGATLGTPGPFIQAFGSLDF